ncbi:phosphatase domain-containing protein [Algoriphagus sp. D3-2-R+10]|uniref:phosphatase domain-containing protein n=1 Tax=Algoriphagus aurantiacus TaxID=3103948 RepID=UPI002B39786A|nr:phosphatase domain-containing protein [Algoriphagus sp. D3-2-R+10]MEB2777275.1 phosphatase domain-containing protein [Algoriphagus sp. D3-2-R+10]
MKKISIIICVIIAIIMAYQLAVYLMGINKQDKIKVEPFLAFGNNTDVFFKGRVIKPYTQKRPSSRNNWLSNIIASVRRYAGSSVSMAKVEITFQEKSYTVATDDDGVFELQIGDSRPVDTHNEMVTFVVLEPVTRKSSTSTATMEVERYSGSVGAISDIDDTIIISHSTDIGKKFWLSISKNALTRRPLPGVSEFYKKLTENGSYPMFYVSSSDWSLFDLIKDFLRFRHIPNGPILLKDKHINLSNVWKSGGGNHNHKFEKIELLFKLYPEMSFYLIGDSGQKDPEIYAEVIEKHPNRVKGVFIRLVDELDSDRRQNLEKAISQTNFHFIESSQEAIQILEHEMSIK